MVSRPRRACQHIVRTRVWTIDLAVQCAISPSRKLLLELECAHALADGPRPEWHRSATGHGCAPGAPHAERHLAEYQKQPPGICSPRMCKVMLLQLRPRASSFCKYLLIYFSRYGSIVSTLFRETVRLVFHHIICQISGFIILSAVGAGSARRQIPVIRSVQFSMLWANC